MQVTIAGEPRTLGDFSAYKAFKAMQIIADVENVWREVLNEGARFKREYEAENFIELDRTAARRQFRPSVLIEIVEEVRDGEVVGTSERPMMQDGRPVMSADPLGHLTEEDWAATDQKLRLPASPSEDLVTAHMIPTAFKMGQAQVLVLLALATTSNAEIERWDEQGAAIVDEELAKAGHELLHRCKADELVRLAAATVALFKEQVSGPFGELVGAVRTTFRSPAPEQEEATVPPPMTVDSTATSPASAPASEDGSDGATETSPTEPASASSLASANG